MSEENKSAGEIGNLADKPIRYGDVSNQILAAHAALKIFWGFTKRMLTNHKNGKGVLDDAQEDVATHLKYLVATAQIGLSGVDCIFDKFGIASPMIDKELASKSKSVLAFLIIKTESVNDADAGETPAPPKQNDGEEVPHGV